MAVSFTLGFHFGYGGIVEDVDDAMLEAMVKLCGAKGFALLAEVADVELKIDAEFVAYFFLTKTIGRTFLCQKCADFIDFVGREFCSSHS